MQVNRNFPQSTPRPDPRIARDLKEEVQKELGDTVLDGFNDSRIDTLQRFFFQGEEFVGFDPAKHLGDGWKAEDRDLNFATKEFSLQPDLNGDFQKLTLDTRNDSVRISTGNSEPGPFEGTCDIENLHMTADGIITRNRATAI